MSSTSSDATPQGLLLPNSYSLSRVRHQGNGTKNRGGTFTYVSRNINKVPHALAHVDANKWFLIGSHIDTPLCIVPLLEQDIVNISSS